MASSKWMAELTMKIGVNAAELKQGLKKASGSLKEFGRRSKVVAQDFRKGMKRNLLSITMMNPALGQMVFALNSASKAFKTLTLGTSLFKTALAATGIGLIVVALGSLVAWMQTTNEGMLAMSRGAEVVKAVFGVLIDRLAKFGGAVVKFFSGDFKGAWEDAGDAVGGFGKNIIEVGKDADKVAKDEFENKKKLIQREKEIGKLMESNSELRLKSRDIEKFSASERRKFAEQELKQIEQLKLLKLATADEEIQLLKDRQALGNNTLEDDKELADLEQARGQLIKQVNREKKTVLMHTAQIGKEAEAAYNKEVTAVQKLQDEMRELNEVKAQGFDGVAVANVAAEMEILSEHLEGVKEKYKNAHAEIMESVADNTIDFGSMIGNAFKGMSNIISDSMKSTEGFFQSFGRFMADFFKGLLIKIVALTVAALLLVAALSMIPGLGATLGIDNVIANAGKLKAAFKFVGGYANGGVTDGGLAMVGERGKELVNLPKGSRVHSAADTKKMMSGGSNGAGTVNLTVNGFVGNQSQLAREISILLDNQRSNTSRTSHL